MMHREPLGSSSAQRRNTMDLGMVRPEYDEDGQPVRPSPKSSPKPSPAPSPSRRSSLELGMRASRHDEAGQPVRASPVARIARSPFPIFDEAPEPAIARSPARAVVEPEPAQQLRSPKLGLGLRSPILSGGPRRVAVPAALATVPVVAAASTTPTAAAAAAATIAAAAASPAAASAAAPTPPSSAAAGPPAMSSPSAAMMFSPRFGNVSGPQRVPFAFARTFDVPSDGEDEDEDGVDDELLELYRRASEEGLSGTDQAEPSPSADAQLKQQQRQQQQQPPPTPLLTAYESDFDAEDVSEWEGEASGRDPAALAFGGLRLGQSRRRPSSAAASAAAQRRSRARLGAVFGEGGVNMIDFDKAPPPSGGSVVRLAAVRASRKQRHELCAEKGKVLTPVRRSARTPQQAVAPTAALLSETGYVYAPNVQLQPAFDAGDIVLVTEKSQAQALPRVTRPKAKETSAPSVPNMEASAPSVPNMEASAPEPSVLSNVTTAARHAPELPPPLAALPLAAAAEHAVRRLEEAAEMALEIAAQAVQASEATIPMEMELTAATQPELEPAAISQPELEPAAISQPELEPAAISQPELEPAAIPPPSQRQQAPRQKRSHTTAAAAPSESNRRSTRARSNA